MYIEDLETVIYLLFYCIADTFRHVDACRVSVALK